VRPRKRRADFFIDDLQLARYWRFAVDRIYPRDPLSMFAERARVLNTTYVARKQSDLLPAETRPSTWIGMRRRARGIFSGFGAEVFEQGFGGGFGVEDVGGGEPGAAELGNAVTHLVELFGGVSVGVDYDLAAVLFGDTEVEIVEVGAGGAGVVFDGYA
jgi:hypothetical protein